MRTIIRRLMAVSAAVFALTVLTPRAIEGQGRGNRANVDPSAGVTLSVELEARIGSFYASRPASDVEALPPGIRRRLERGKPLPPGIARKAPPPELNRRLDLPAGFEVVEVGLDVLLVEVATNVIHDVLMDVVR